MLRRPCTRLVSDFGVLRNSFQEYSVVNKLRPSSVFCLSPQLIEEWSFCSRCRAPPAQGTGAVSALRCRTTRRARCITASRAASSLPYAPCGISGDHVETVLMCLDFSHLFTIVSTHRLTVVQVGNFSNLYGLHGHGQAAPLSSVVPP